MTKDHSFMTSKLLVTRLCLPRFSEMCGLVPYGEENVDPCKRTCKASFKVKIDVYGPSSRRKDMERNNYRKRLPTSRYMDGMNDKSLDECRWVSRKNSLMFLLLRIHKKVRRDPLFLMFSNMRSVIFGNSL